MNGKIAFTGQNQIIVENIEPRPLAEGEVSVRALYSLISTGTETIVLHRKFELGSHYDRWVKYPFYPGYSLIGEITEVSASVESLKKGDIVACRSSHASHHIVPADGCVLVDSGIDLQQAAWFALGKITAMGAKAAQEGLGDSVLIIGAGPIGQLSLRWAVAAGAENIIVADRFEKRIELAVRGGATAGIQSPIEEAMQKILESNYNQLPDIVIDTTGNEIVFSYALQLCAKFGRVVILGDTGTPTSQRLTKDVITRGICIVGAHDTHETQDWNQSRIIRLFFSLVKRGRFDLRGLNTHVFKPEQFLEAYDTAETKREEAMGILFDWT